ncbi:MAG: DUF4199 domain-containing protein, partial [Pseudomonadota bacterium]
WVWLSGRGTDPSTFDSGEKIGYTIMVLTMSLVFFAIKQTRDKELGGELKFGQGVAIGTTTNLVASGLFGVFNIIYMRFLAPDFLPTYAAYYRQGIENSDQSAEAIAEQLTDFDANQGLFLNPEFNGFVMFATVFLIGLIITLIAAFALKTK